jgi:hypothetical protein
VSSLAQDDTWKWVLSGNKHIIIIIIICCLCVSQATVKEEGPPCAL